MSATRKRKVKSKPQPKQRKPIDWRRLGQYVLVTLGVVATGITGWVGYHALSEKLDMPIREVIVNGSFRYLDDAKINEAVAPLASSGFLSIDVRDVQKQVLEVPWVATTTPSCRPPTLTSWLPGESASRMPIRPRLFVCRLVLLLQPDAMYTTTAFGPILSPTTAAFQAGGTD